MLSFTSKHFMLSFTSKHFMLSFTCKHYMQRVVAPNIWDNVLSLAVPMSVSLDAPSQGSLSDGDGSVQLTSLYQPF